MTTLDLTQSQYLELEKLALGAFMPVTQFMNEQTFHSVVDDMRLPSGAPFPLPIVLDIDEAVAVGLNVGDDVILRYGGDGVGHIRVESLFRCDKTDVVAKVFGTTDREHPGVRFFLDGGDCFLGGPTTLNRRVKTDLSRFELTPEETRNLFAERGWKTVVGFQTRNVPHRAHEYLQRVALEQADGLFVQPLLGRKKKGDYTPEAILKGYQALIDGFYPKERVVFGILTTSMRYAGPREALFHAIIRRNYGCTHFIVGRDHAGVGNYYSKYAAHSLTRAFDGELGIEILRLHGPYYCTHCDGIVTEHTCPHEKTDPPAVTHISGTDIRAMLSQGMKPDPRIIRQSVIDSLDGVPLFIESETT